MRAVKGNKAYKVDETTKDRYRKDGFDITDDSGKLLESGRGKTVDYAQYEKLVEQNAALKKQLDSAGNAEVVKALKAEIKDLKKQLAAVPELEK